MNKIVRERESTAPPEEERLPDLPSYNLYKAIFSWSFYFKVSLYKDYLRPFLEEGPQDFVAGTFIKNIAIIWSVKIGTDRSGMEGPWQRANRRVRVPLDEILGHDQNGPDGSSLDLRRAAHPQPL
ncbi:uncharacterized protein LOC117175516 [Belonocnema kinseyi]|uniref:uncharacterized protein LOC117175516 n=1 Tax=Belonocnema kinseyi TaxID=2817044 RepID=UPI00143D28FB|nr:uncharacterized protein LOC117175516 [Belonocnema kinseyi]